MFLRTLAYESMTPLNHNYDFVLNRFNMQSLNTLTRTFNDMFLHIICDSYKRLLVLEIYSNLKKLTVI